MNLSLELERYLKIRRNLGYDLGTSERVLKQFVSFLESTGATHIRTALFLQWKMAFGKASQSTWARRLGMVRSFASWLYSLDTCHEIPPQNLIPGHYRRQQPYIYTDSQIIQIIEAAALLPSSNGLRAITYPTLFGLVSVTGLRISEVISLDDRDVDLVDGVISVRNGKNRKERLLPVTESTKNRLKEYARKRDRLLGYSPEPFFIADTGNRLSDCIVRYNFAVTCQKIGLRAEQRFNRHGTGPRIHDLRHTFAVKVLINWYQENKDIDREMLKLVNYLGHQKVTHTYWYIEAVPELLALAARRAESYIRKEVQQ
ncbi:Site-specific recombinase XerD [Mucilaginibacter pineti]|uniref:Site-specific recombinase XerD n=1 Tax=Mucilaginibacter pineti TaxID=1391627 RepID=A0A1G7PC83_9SPHI|nr:tyrosine-type recombinase/integrase [Mucilaginibacter pineti]SDF83249.1 Site-specific recombinase XerD [Mucilaginibacter pineti]